MKKNKQSFDEKNDLITVRPKKIIEQVKTFDGETDFIVPRKHTYIDKRNNTIVSLSRDNSHSSVDTVGEYANAAAAGGSQSGCPQIGFNASANNLNNTDYQVTIGGITGGQAPYSYTIVVTNSGNSTSYTGQIGAAGTAIQKTGFPTANGGVNGGAYSVLVTITDANGCATTPQQWSGNFTLVGYTAPSGSGGGGGIKGNITNYGTGVTVANANQNQNQQGQQVTATNYGTGTTIIKNIPAVNITNFSASSAVLQPDTISVNVSYQDGKAPYTVDYTITDQNGVVTVQQSNNTNSLQDSLQPSPSGLSAGQYTITVKVTGTDGTSDSKSEIVNVKGKTVVQGNLKLNNLNVTTTNLTTSGFDVNLSWSDGTSPYQVDAMVKSGGFTSPHVMSENSKTHSWTQSLILDNNGQPIYGNYDIGVQVTDSVGDVISGTTQILVPAPKPQPLVGQLYDTNRQNASFDVEYKFTNGVAPFSLTANLNYPVDASGNSQVIPITQTNLTNTGVFPIVITPDASGAVLEGYYNLLNCVVTDANGQTANLNDLKPYLNGVKANIAPPPTPTPTPPPTPAPSGGGSVIIGGGGGGGVEPTPEVVAAPKDKSGINWLLVILALGVGYAIIRKKQ
jgi:hypothetical protein